MSKVPDDLVEVPAELRHLLRKGDKIWAQEYFDGQPSLVTVTDVDSDHDVHFRQKDGGESYLNNGELVFVRPGYKTAAALRKRLKEYLKEGNNLINSLKKVKDE